MVCFTNRTAPSPNRKFTPPECKLLKPSLVQSPVDAGFGLGMLIPRPGRPSKLAVVEVARKAQTAALFLIESRSPTKMVLLVPSTIVATDNCVGLLLTSGPNTSRLQT